MNQRSSLLRTVRQPLSQELAARLVAIDSEDFSKVISRTKKSLAKEGKTSSITDEEAEIGLKQYYGLIAIAPAGTEYSVSGALDPFWHAHVLDTREYDAFCRRAPGNFIHHVPLDWENRVEFDRVSDVYLRTGRALRETFSNVSDRTFPREATVENVICTMFWGDIQN